MTVEMCHLAQQIRPDLDTRKSFRMIGKHSRIARQFSSLGYSQKDLYQKICHYFFDEMGMNLHKTSELSVADCLVPRVIQNGGGPKTLVALLFVSLLEEAGFSISGTQCHDPLIFKIKVDGRSEMIDFENRGAFLGRSQLIDYINQGKNLSKCTEQGYPLVINYLYELKRLSEACSSDSTTRLIHTRLMSYEPYNLSHLKNRALLAYETGQYRLAWKDLHSYFFYTTPESSQNKLRGIYLQAGRKLGEILKIT